MSKLSKDRESANSHAESLNSQATDKFALLFEKLAFMLPEESRHILQELYDHYIELKNQSERLRQVQSALEKLRKKDIMLETITSQVPGMLYQFMRRPDGTFTVPYCSEGIKELYGCAPEDVYDDFYPIFKRVLREDQRKIIQTADESAKNLSKWMCEYRVKLPDKPIKWLFGHSIPEKMADGTIIWSGYNLDITEQKLAEEQLHKKDAMLANIASQVPGMLYQFMRKPDGSFSVPYSSDGVKEIFGCTPEAVRDDFDPIFKAIMPEDRNRILETIDKSMKSLSQWMSEYRVQLPGEPVKWVFGNSIPEKMADGTIIWSGYNLDITERKLAEEEKKKLQDQLTQAQKIESVGRLAGGVAHDFNNMLSVILGFTEMAMEKTDASDPIHSDLEEVYKAANRSASITRQLLTFARRQAVAPEVINLNDIIENMLKMLRRLIGEDIDLAWYPGTDIWPVMIDPSQVDQILANLCVNAQDAITNGGKILIETKNISFDEKYCAEHVGFSPGAYILLSVSDDGSGMSQETMDHLFEPFYTTKAVNQGTGMGLATVYGIVKQNNGFINVYSEIEQGTTFNIYLPRHMGETKKLRKKDLKVFEVRGSETILLVEDESAILKITRMIMERLGYSVLAAHTPDEAISLANEYSGEIHLLMTDVIMPEMNGRDLAEHMLSLYPDIKCLFMSGYTANVIAHHGMLNEGVQFIQKPFSKRDLAIKIRAVLDKTR